MRSHPTLTEQHLVEFQQLYKEHFGVEITKKEALEKGLRLIRLVRASAFSERNNP